MNQNPLPPQPKKPMPTWAIVLIVLGSLVVLAVVGLVVLLGLIAFACSRH